MQGLLIVSLLLFCTASSTLWVGQGQSTFDVLSYGAKGDGQTDDSEAFLRAWNDACGATGNSTDPTLLAPEGHSFKLQPTNFKGPCRFNNINVQILGTILAPQKSEWKGDINNSWTWIVFNEVNGLSLNGTGVIDGQGSEWWNKKDTLTKASGIDSSLSRSVGLIPTALTFDSCNDLKVLGIKQINGPGGHIHLLACNGVTLLHLNITSPRDSPNTDGIDISYSSQVEISKSFIGVGDDCIAIKAGCSYLRIHHIECGPGHGISIGSLRGNDTAEEIHVWNCSINGATNGARIKTWPVEGNGYARKISFEHIKFRNTSYPIIIDQHYGLLTQNEGGIKVSDVAYYDIEGTSAKDRAISLDCGSKYCSNITMSQINITSADPAKNATTFCSNVQGTFNSITPTISCSSHLEE